MESEQMFKQTEIGKIPGDWQVVQLAKLCEVKSGKRLPKGSSLVKYETNHPYIRVRDLSNMGVKVDELLFIDEETYNKISRYIITKDDVYISIVGTIGITGLIPYRINGANLTENCARLTNFKKVKKEFVAFYLNTKVGQEQIKSLTVGTTQLKLALFRIKQIKIPIPSLEEQGLIVKLFLDINGKIELNHQMNITLEKIGQTLFKRWFIDFEFPNEKGKPYKSSGGEMIDSELGEIPKGWDVRPFSEVIAVSPRRKLTKGSVAKKVSMADLERWQSWITSWAREEFKGGSVFKNGDTLFARITPCLEKGKTAFVSFLDHEEVAFGSTEFIVLSPKVIKSPAFIFFLARSTSVRDEAIMSMTGTSGRQRVPNEFFDKYLIACPPDSLIDTFDKLVGPMLVIINSNALELASLGAIRDSLLPRLMSGQIRVPAG